jgi:hypothetical protein
MNLSVSFVITSKLKRGVSISRYYKHVGEQFLTLASYSYCDEAAMKNGKCCKGNKEVGFLELSGTVQQDNYTFAVLRSKASKQVVVTLTGTKGSTQLLKEGWYSNMSAFGKPEKKMFISTYFNTVFTQVKEKLKPKLIELQKKYSDHQFIFTGHSLGAAMATIFALDSVLDGYLTKSKDSPALINLASPRVGNYIFAAHVMYHVPVVFRLVRDGDVVTSIPPCSLIMKCSNKQGLDKFTGKEADFTGNNIKEDKNYWHIAGLIYYNEAMTTFKECGKEYSERHPDKDCVPSRRYSSDNHVTYLKKQVSKICSGARKYFI